MNIDIINEIFRIEFILSPKIIYSLLFLFFVWFVFVLTKIRLVKHLFNEIIFATPTNCKVMYITSLNDEKYNILFVVYGFFVKFIINFLKPFMIKVNYHDRTIVFDINDVTGIISAIKYYSQNNYNLLIFVESNGGDSNASDNICTALRTYQDNYTENKPKLQITCVVNNIAHSAASMIVLSADTIHMSEFATLSPVDPNITLEIDSCNYNISYQLYDVLNRAVNDKIVSIDSKDFLIMKHCYNNYKDSIVMFKTLQQYKLANNTNKQKLLNTFCRNIIPHHRTLSIFDIKKIGIKVLPITHSQQFMLTLLENYQHYSLYMI